MWSRAATETRVQSQVDDYNATHKNQVELRLVPTDEYVAVVGNAATANELPDLFSADVVFMPNWTSQGLFTDITDRIDGLPGIENVGPAHIDASTWEGKKYGLPFIIDLSVWMYNKDLFTQAGLDPENPPTNLDRVRRRRPCRPGARHRRHLRHLLRWELRRLQRLHLVADHLGRWRRRHERRGHRGAPQLRRRQGDLPDLQRAVGRGRHQPRIQQEAGPTWTQPFPAGKVGIMPMPASLQESEGMPLDNLGVTAIAGMNGGESTFVGGDSIGISKDSQEPRGGLELHHLDAR